jgi:hypothetical protein
MLPRAIKPKIDIPFCTLFLCGQTDIATMKVNESGAFLKLFLVGGGTVAQTCAFGWRISAREYWGMLDKIPLLIDLDYQCFVHWPEF